MTQQDLIDRIDKLEILFSEQQHTVETLNSVVTQQADLIDTLEDQIGQLKQQFRELRQQIPETTIVDEKPPHY